LYHNVSKHTYNFLSRPQRILQCALAVRQATKLTFLVRIQRVVLMRQLSYFY